MVHLLKKCKCRYTIDQEKEICELCNSHFHTAHPPRFSLYDRYETYRRRMKELAKQRGLLRD